VPPDAKFNVAGFARASAISSFSDCAGTAGRGLSAGLLSFAGSATAPARKQPATVGSFKANAFGLHHVHGNVWEWTEDYGHANFTGAPADGSAWTSGECGFRVIRGGGWGSGTQVLRSAGRGRYSPVRRDDSLGFRVARTL
jgi:formylglycine-generating enzyme required for sulfatase activity